MCCLVAGNGFDGCESEGMEIQPDKEVLPFSQEDRGQSQMDLIDEAGGQVLTNRGNTTTNPNIFCLWPRLSPSVRPTRCRR